MATVGLNFGSATSGAGFDVATTVTSILAIQQAIETPWKNQLTSLQAQDTAFTGLGTDLSTLTTAMQALTTGDGVLAEKQGSSSDTNVLNLSSADPTAVAGSHTVTVQHLASTASEYTDEITDPTAVLAGQITINGTAIPIDSTNNTLSSLSAAINADSLGVTASVITDANGSRLSLVSGTSGAGGQAIISGMTNALTYTTATNTTPTTLNLNTGQSGVNASLTVDGLSISSASNTVSGAIPGVTFQLLSVPATAENIQIQVTNNNSDIEAAVQNFVTAYNAVNTDINTQEGNDSSGNPEPLFGNSTLSLIQSQLQTALLGGSASGSINSITQLGITVNDDGSLTFNSSSLDTTLNSNFSDVLGYLQNPGSFGQSLATTLNNLGSQAPNGAVYLAEQQNSNQETALNKDISNEETLLATEKSNLTTELNTANEILQSIPEQLNEVNEMYSAVTGYNTNSNS
ncbi:MAG TPA: flagellar filament capping protein FliD [Granulicella sp.]|jgi:flagellar hook-associated protein 2|nr:flagellar filament capping protein FliD [Granulicella sp.]